MNRRTFLAMIPAATVSLAGMSQKRRRYKFKLRTRGGSIIGTTAEGRGVQEAEVRVRKRYPGCTILRVEEV
jgi:hypothetical protein